MSSECISIAVTVLATLAALFLGLKEEIKRKIWKPKLELKVSSIEPHCISIATSGPAGKNFSIAGKVALRAEVYNSGSAASTNTWIRFLKYYYLDIESLNAKSPDYGSADVVWQTPLEEPVSLKWVGIEPNREVTIPNKSYLLAEIAELNEKEYNLTLHTSSPLSNDNNRQRAARHHCIKVMLGSDQLKPITRYIFFTVEKDPFVSLAIVCDKPPKKSQGGIFGLIKKMGEENQSES